MWTPSERITWICPRTTNSAVSTFHFRWHRPFRINMSLSFPGLEAIHIKKTKHKDIATQHKARCCAWSNDVYLASTQNNGSQFPIASHHTRKQNSLLALAFLTHSSSQISVLPYSYLRLIKICWQNGLKPCSISWYL